MKKILLTAALILALCAMGGCFQIHPPGYLDGNDSGDSSDAAIESAGQWPSGFWQSTDAAADTGQQGQPSHDPGCSYQYHGKDFCGNFAEIGFIDTDDLYGNVEIEILAYYHCYISVIIADAAGNPVAVLTAMEEIPGDPAFESLLPGELNTNLYHDPGDTPDMYNDGPPGVSYYYNWNGEEEQTGWMVADMSYYYVNLYIYFSPEEAIGLPMATDTEEFYYDAFLNNLKDS